MWRFVEDSLGGAPTARCAGSSAFLADVVGGGACRSPSARCCRRRCSCAARRAAVSITLGTAFLLFQYVQLMTRPLEDLVQQLETVQKANGAMRRVAELLALEPTVVDRGTEVAAAGSARGVLPRHRGSPTTTMPRPDPSHRQSYVDVSPAAVRWASSGAPAAARPRSRVSCCASSSRPPDTSRLSGGSTSPISRWPSCVGGSPSSPQEVGAVRGHLAPAT